MVISIWLLALLVVAILRPLHVSNSVSGTVTSPRPPWPLPEHSLPRSLLMVCSAMLQCLTIRVVRGHAHCRQRVAWRLRRGLSSRTTGHVLPCAVLAEMSGRRCAPFGNSLHQLFIDNVAFLLQDVGMDVTGLDGNVCIYIIIKVAHHVQPQLWSDLRASWCQCLWQPAAGGCSKSRGQAGRL